MQFTLNNQGSWESSAMLSRYKCLGKQKINISYVEDKKMYFVVAGMMYMEFCNF